MPLFGLPEGKERQKHYSNGWNFPKMMKDVTQQSKNLNEFLAENQQRKTLKASWG